MQSYSCCRWQLVYSRLHSLSSLHLIASALLSSLLLLLPLMLLMLMYSAFFAGNHHPCSFSLSSVPFAREPLIRCDSCSPLPLTRSLAHSLACATTAHQASRTPVICRQGSQGDSKRREEKEEQRRQQQQLIYRPLFSLSRLFLRRTAAASHHHHRCLPPSFPFLVSAFTVKLAASIHQQCSHIYRPFNQTY